MKIPPAAVIASPTVKVTTTAATNPIELSAIPNMIRMMTPVMTPLSAASYAGNSLSDMTTGPVTLAWAPDFP